MNERIKELAEQAGINIDSFQFSGTPIKHIVDEPSLEKFAELIVKESIMQMAVQIDKFGDNQSNNSIWYKSEEAVKKHFGIKE